MTIACPYCGTRVEVQGGQLEEHEEPPHAVETKTKKLVVHVRCIASGARVEALR